MGVLKNLVQSSAYRNPAIFEWIEAVSTQLDAGGGGGGEGGGGGDVLLLDVNSRPWLESGENAAPAEFPRVNWLVIDNSSAGQPCGVSAKGSDNNVGLYLKPKGTGAISMRGAVNLRHLVLDNMESGSLGLANVIVNPYTALIFHQWTGDQELILPDPTGDVDGRVLFILHDGTVPFTLNGVTGDPWPALTPGSGRVLIWSSASSRWVRCGETAPGMLLRTITITNADFTEAVNGAAQVFNIGAILPADAVVLAYDTFLTTQFSGGGATQLSLDVGIAADPNSITSGRDVFQVFALGADSQAQNEGVHPKGDYAGEQLVATLTPDAGHALTGLTAGSITIRVWFAVVGAG